MSDRQPRGKEAEAAEPVAGIVRDELRAELRAAKDELRAEMVRAPQRRTARLYGSAAAAALYAGGALTALLALLFDLAMPAWLAALLVTVLLGVLAVTLRNLARQQQPARGSGAPSRAAAEGEARQA